jgi:hypothetical protein
MPSSVEEYLQKATECEEKARAADQADISNSFRRLAEHWRILANIVGKNSETASRLGRR